MVQPFLDLVDRASMEAEFDVAKTYISKLKLNQKIEKLNKMER